MCIFPKNKSSLLYNHKYKIWKILHRFNIIKYTVHIQTLPTVSIILWQFLLLPHLPAPNSKPSPKPHIVFSHHDFVVVVQLLSCVQVFVTPWTATCQASLSFTISLSLLKLMSIESVMPCNHLILRQPLLLLPQSFPASEYFPVTQLFASGGQNWSFSFSNGPTNEYSGLISFRIEWFDLAVQGSLKTLFQHNLKASIIWRSIFFIVQLSHSYMTTGKTIALTR